MHRFVVDNKFKNDGRPYSSISRHGPLLYGRALFFICAGGVVKKPHLCMCGRWQIIMNAPLMKLHTDGRLFSLLFLFHPTPQASLFSSNRRRKFAYRSSDLLFMQTKLFKRGPLFSKLRTEAGIMYFLVKRWLPQEESRRLAFQL
jgi:hypothetical protein